MIVSERKLVGALLLFSCYTLVLLPDGGAGNSRSPSAAHVSSVWTPPSSPPPRIAYVFAGSPRSFYCPKVHWSIKHYLMEGLGGDPYVFVRAAGNDNHNNHTGEGTTQPLPYTQQDIERLLARVLRPSAISWVQLGSSEEKEEMSRNFPGERHAIYRKYDRRRYSMFYHRSMAYRMVQDYEKKHGFKFDWVVMARLDTAWVAAPLPIHHFTPDRVYTPETGLLVNDQFMLMPRQYSDAVYDLNLRLEEGVICLGGPDVPRWHCSAGELRAHNVSHPEASMMLKECCATVFGGKGDDQVGYSETILSRHLARAEVPLAPATFPFTISRLGAKPSISREDPNACNPECFRLHQYANSVNFYLPLLDFGYSYTKDGYPSTLGRGASVSHVLRCEALGDSKALWQPKHALDLAPNTDASQIFPLERLAAWRLRIVSNRLECLTVHGGYITTAPCKELDRVRRYVREQIFLLQVQHHDARDAAHMPLRMGAGVHPGLVPSTSSDGDEDVPATTSIVTWSEARGVVCLTVMGNTSDSEVTTAKRDLASPAQRWLVPKGRFGGHAFGSTVANIRPASDPSLCIQGHKRMVEIALAPVKGRPPESGSPNTTTVATLNLAVVKCRPILTDTNFDLESIE